MNLLGAVTGFAIGIVMGWAITTPLWFLWASLTIGLDGIPEIWQVLVYIGSICLAAVVGCVVGARS